MGMLSPFFCFKAIVSVGSQNTPAPLKVQVNIFKSAAQLIAVDQNLHRSDIPPHLQAYLPPSSKTYTDKT